MQQNIDGIDGIDGIAVGKLVYCMENGMVS
jgi:hypothetical protein